MILLYNLIFISLITFTILYIINKLLNVKNQSFKIISYLVIISSILVNFVLLSPIENDYSEFYLRAIVILFLIVFIIISYKMIFKKSLLDLLNNTKTTINNTEINHNYQTNIDTIDNSNTFNTSQTNNHLEQINNVTNIESKPQTNYEKKNKNSKDLDDIKLENLYKNLLKHEIINDNIQFGYFKSKFLKEIMILNNLSLAEYKLFYKKLKSTFYIDIKENKYCYFFNLNNDSYRNTNVIKDYHHKKIEIIFENI